MHYTLADLITDITQNGVESGADLVELEIIETICKEKGEFRFTVRDNGKGMSPEELELAQDPFVTDGIKHPHRKVGLGLPFLIQTAKQSGGDWEMKSEKGNGTEVSAWFDTNNVDTPPVGDIPGLFQIVLLFSGPKEIVIRRSRLETNNREKDIVYEIKKTELIEVLGNLEDTESFLLLSQYLNSMEE